MADNDSQGMSPIERAKKRERPPVGGAPPINMTGQPGGGILHREAQNPQANLQAPQGVPFAEAINPQNPAEATQPRSQEEIHRDLAAFQQGVSSMQQGQVPTPSDKPPEPADKPPDSTEAEAEEEDDSWYQYSGSSGEFADQVEDVLNNEARKKWIEAHLKPMAVEDLIIHGEVHQEVTILPGKLVITFRTTSGAEDLSVKKLMYSSEAGSTRYIVDKFSLMNLAVGLFAVNDKRYPPHLNDKDEFDEEMFDIKFKKVLKMPSQLLADLVGNYIWFDRRVRKLLVAEELGNG